MSHTRRRAAGPAVLGVQRHAPHSRRRIFPAKSPDRGRPVHAPQGAHHGFRHGEVRAPDSQQTLPRDEFLRLALRTGRPREGQPLEQLETQDRAGARDAGHGADGKERRKPEGLHGFERFFLLAGDLPGRHRFAPQACDGHLPHAPGRALPHRLHLLRVPGQVPRTDRVARHRQYAAAYGRYLRRVGPRCRAGAHRRLPQGAGVLQFLGQQHLLRRADVREGAADRPAADRQTVSHGL